MNLIPYKKISVRSNLSPNEIKNNLTQLVSKPDWNLKISKLLNNRVLEGIVSDKAFTIVMGKYGLTYGMTSLLPIMKGKIKSDNSLEGSIVSVIIRPFKTGIFVLSIFYLLSFVALYFSIKKNLPEVFIVSVIFLCVTYFSLITRFNYESKIYTDLIKNNL